MKRLENVMTVRLPKDDLKIIEEISKNERKDKSENYMVFFNLI